MSVEPLSAGERLAVPDEHLGVLVAPPTAAIHAALAADADAGLGAARVGGVPVVGLRAGLRRRLGLSRPVVVTGHQPEFVHAGVFAKLLAAGVLSAQAGGSSALLVVDSDTPGSTQLAVPVVADRLVARWQVPIPGLEPGLPFEAQRRLPVERWAAFFQHVAALVDGWETLLPAYADGLCASTHEQAGLCEVVEAGQAAVSRALGIGPPSTVRVSQLAATPEFRRLVAHLLLSAREFAAAYNAAWRTYRERHRVRGAQRPVPPLLIDAERVELPLWVMQPGQARRRLYVAGRGAELLLLADDEPIGRESTGAVRDGRVCTAGFGFEAAGWQLRPRALLLSAFVRLLLSDVFIHGVGGARYDEMTADFARRFFGVELPCACCVSATLLLPLPRFGVGRRELAALRHARHDLQYNPQRYLHGLPEDLLRRRDELIQRAIQLRQQRPPDRLARRETFLQIRAVNRELLDYDTQALRNLERQWQALEQRGRSDEVAADREYFFALHPRAAPAELLERLKQRLRSG